jgi:hypothetical protein
VKRHLSNSRARLGQLQALASKTEADERAILKKAEARLAEVSASIERHRPGVQAAPDKFQDRYLALVEERGQLHTIIAKARDALGG